MRSKRAWRLLGVLFVFGTGGAPLAAQSISGGAVEGRIIDALGDPIFDAEVTLIAQSSGAQYRTVSSRGGDVLISALPPGDYDVRAEAIGYRPRLVRGVPVRPGSPSRFTVLLEPEAPPVTRVDTVAFAGGAAGWIRPGTGRWLSRFELNDLPDHGRTLADLTRFSSRFSDDLQGEGLPTRFTRFYVDGVPVEGARLPGGSGDPLAALMLPRSAFTGAEIISGDPDVEWVDWGGTIVSGLTRAGGDRGEAEAFGDYTGGPLWTSSAFEGDVPSSRSIRGGGVVSLPIVPDTTHLVVGVEGWSLETPRPAVLGTPFAGAPAELGQPYLEPFEAVTAFGRLDWTLRGGNRFHIRANAASLLGPDGAGIGTPFAPGAPGATEGQDASVGAGVYAGVGRNLALEARLSLETSTRTGLGSPGLGGADFPATTLATVGLPIGTDPALPSEVVRTAVTLAPTLHYDRGAHQIKGGGRLVVPRYTYTGTTDAAGRFVFGGTDGILSGEGAWFGADGDAATSEFTMLRLVGYIQDRWTVAPGLAVTLGLQSTTEYLPESTWNTSLVWDSLTAMGSDSVSRLSGLGTRFGFEWDVGAQGTTVLRGAAGLSFAPLDPYDVHQLLVGDGRVSVRQAFNGLDTWPDAPSGSNVFTTPRVALLGPSLEMPRTARGSVGLSRTLGAGTAVHLAGVFRRTEHLQRWADLNLALPSGTTDQLGRPIYGTLGKSGALVRSRLTLNRRFPGVERALALNTDGWSLYSAGTVAIDRHSPRTDFFASYTYSQTEDNLVGARLGSVDATLDPGLMSGGDPWAEGRSDFDVPHRFVAGLGLRLPVLAGATVAATYRFRSGDPFTPGFRPGVDPNGDGADRNDPAFGGGPDAAALLSEYTCEAAPSGQPFARNACRGPSQQGLDLRLRVTVFQLGGRAAELTFDALNLIESESGLRDTALHLVDPDASLVRAGTETVIPLLANPDFGTLLVRHDPGRFFRIGLRIGGSR
ncbi:MAG: carboxypeptidase-like regulatory domain-containing protein [Gemmatimonadota bacterium]|nr:carboxypeptidase regulatory-like domain-containing protein [Gemmatimonadota bacterium]